MSKLRVLIVNIQLNNRSGTETYTYDLANELLRSGHMPWVYTPNWGDIASELRDRGLTVVDDLDLLPGIPDVIHGHHYIETFLALMYFPTAPGLFVCHDRLSWHSAPPVTSRIARYIAVDYNCLDRLIGSSVPKEKMLVFFNPVDLTRFQARSLPLPSKPQRALIFSNYASENDYIPIVKKACAKMGVSLDVIGQGANNMVAKPEDFLKNYDIVFAKARCALEAMACGAAVVPCDKMGCAPMVNLKNIEEMRRLNFGMKTLTNPITQDFLKAQIEAYDPLEASRVSEWIRSHASLQEHVKEYVALYEELIEERRSLCLLEAGYDLRQQKDMYQKVCRDFSHCIVEKEQFRALAAQQANLIAAQQANSISRRVKRKLWGLFKGNTA